VPTMTVLIGNMGNTVVRTVQEATDWTGRKTRVLPDYQEQHERKERQQTQEKNDQASSDSNRTRERPLGRTSPMGPSMISPSGETSQPRVESPLETRDEEQHASDPSASQRPQGESSDRSPSQVQAEVILLAREISKLAKDACQQPPKKYGWEEWVNWLKVLGDEAWVAARRDEELGISVDLDPHPHHVDHQRHPKKHHRRYRSQPNPVKTNREGGDWNWTWLDDRGPLFSPETETEWILSRLCSRLEHLMTDT
jgi:potassium channel subfamily K